MKPSYHAHLKKEDGNILFLILLAVVLFAALSYAVTSSMRGGGNNASSEKLQTTAAELINYSTLVEQTVTRLRLSGNCNDSQISFLYDSNGNGVVETGGADRYYNSAAPADKHCHVFDQAGGGLIFKEKLKTDYQQASGTWLNNGSVNGWQTSYGGAPIFVTSNAVNTTAQDLILIVPFISKELCSAINLKLNGADYPTLTNSYWYPWLFAGTFDSSMTQDVSRTEMTGCVYKAGDNYYEYYNVLISR